MSMAIGFQVRVLPATTEMKNKMNSQVIAAATEMKNEIKGQVIVRKRTAVPKLNIGKSGQHWSGGVYKVRSDRWLMSKHSKGLGDRRMQRFGLY